MLLNGVHAVNIDGSSSPGAVRQFSVEIDCVADEEWDRLASDFDDVNPEQTAVFSHHHWKGKDKHLLLRENGVPVAGARVAVINLPLVGRGLAFLRFGPFWRRKGRAADTQVYHSMIRALVDEFCDRRGHCLTILPRPHPDYLAQEVEWLREEGFVRRRDFDDKERFVVNTGLDEAGRRQSLSQSWRSHLNKALRNAIDIRTTDREDEIAAFRALYVSMMERKHFASTTPVHLTGKLMSTLPEGLKPRLFVAYSGEKLVAGATIGLFGDTAYYMFGATADEALPLHAGYALQWSIMQWLHERGCRWYDLGGAAHEQGLRQLKNGLVGKAGQVVVMEGEFDRWAGASGRLAGDVVLGLRDLRRRVRYGAGTDRSS